MERRAKLQSAQEDRAAPADTTCECSGERQQRHAATARAHGGPPSSSRARLTLCLSVTFTLPCLPFSQPPIPTPASQPHATALTCSLSLTQVIARLVGYSHGEALISCPNLAYVDLTGFEELREVPWQLFEMKSIRTINCTRCAKIESIGCQFPLMASSITSLILDGCSSLAELPDSLAKKCSNLTELGLANCSGLHSLPKWVNDIERKGAGVIRPAHLA